MRVLVDTRMTELRPAVADHDPRLRPPSMQNVDLAGIDIVVNTHLHFDHCGGNYPFAGRRIHIQRRELDDAGNDDDYTTRGWVEAPGVRSCRSTSNSSRFLGSGSSRRRAHAACRSSSSRLAGAPSSLAATWRVCLGDATSRTPKARGWCAAPAVRLAGSGRATSRAGHVLWGGA